MSASWSLGDGPPFAPDVLCGNSVATCTQDRHLWIWIYPWISTKKSVDMDMDMDGKFHIHGKPGHGRHFSSSWINWRWPYCGSFPNIHCRMHHNAYYNSKFFSRLIHQKLWRASNNTLIGRVSNVTLCPQVSNISFMFINFRWPKLLYCGDN